MNAIGAVLLHDPKVVQSKGRPMIRFSVLFRDSKGNALLDIKGFLYHPQRGLIPPHVRGRRDASGRSEWFRFIDVYATLEEALLRSLRKLPLVQETFGKDVELHNARVVE